MDTLFTCFFSIFSLCPCVSSLLAYNSIYPFSCILCWLLNLNSPYISTENYSTVFSNLHTLLVFWKKWFVPFVLLFHLNSWCTCIFHMVTWSHGHTHLSTLCMGKVRERAREIEAKSLPVLKTMNKIKMLIWQQTRSCHRGWCCCTFW